MKRPGPGLADGRIAHRRLRGGAKRRNISMSWICKPSGSASDFATHPKLALYLDSAATTPE
jgi:hypothetical protein